MTAVARSRVWALTGLAAAAAVALGGLVALYPQLAVVLLVGLLVAGVLLTAPLRYMPALLLAGITILPSALLEMSVRGISVPLGGQATIVVAITVVMLVRLGVRRTPVELPRLPGRALLFYVGVLLFSAAVGLWQDNWQPGLESDLGRQLSYALAFVVGANAFRRVEAAQRMEAVRAIAYVVVGAAVFAILFWAYEHDLLAVPGLTTLFEDAHMASEYAGRSIMPFVQDSPNVGAVVFVVLGSYVGASLATGRRHRALGIATALLCLAATLTTQSRSGLVAATAATIAYIAVLPASGGRRRRAVAGALVIAALGFGGYQLFPSDRTFSQQGTLINREQIWTQAQATIARYPVFGSGYHFSVRDPFIQDVADPALGSASVRRNSIHSDYLGQMVDAGLLGLASLAVVLVALLRLGLVTRRRNDAVAALGTGLVCAVAALAVAMVFNAVTQSAVMAMVLWLLAGFTGAARCAE